ncbi:hypothetical protein NMY22_g8505 [Coprinellus aureogranulatus]|nr:hypothetical protein NMY22_g8505 [Coprinellus aureogranulatus]
MYARNQDALRAQSRTRRSDSGVRRNQTPSRSRQATDHCHGPGVVNHVGQAYNANLGVNHGVIVQNSYHGPHPQDLISRLNPILDASYTRNMTLSPPNSKCFPGTRRRVIRIIKKWAETSVHDAVPHIMWIFGYTGCGKSAIAQAVAEDYGQQGLLVACFFFFRGSGDRSGVSRFATTIASQMVTAIPATKPLVEAAVADHPWLLSHATASLGHQFSYLVYNPLRTVSHTLPGPVLIIIDGFDECGDREEASRFIEDMISFFRRFPDAPFRILIASRVEDHIHHCLHSSPEVKLLNLVEHTTDKDIATALDFAIEKEKRRRVLSCDRSWPSQSDRQTLVEHIGGSFIFLTTIIKLLFDPNLMDGLTPMQRLPVVLSTEPNFDDLYNSILKRSQHLPHFRNVIGTIAHAFKSLSVSQVANLLELDTSDVVNVLVNLQAIIQVPGDDRTPITLWHTSVRDFVTSEDRAGPFFVSHIHHVLIARGCIRQATDSNPSATREYSRRYALQHLSEFLTTHGENAADRFNGTLAGLGRCLDQPIFLHSSVYIDGWPALQVACEDKDWKLVRTLVSMGANINVSFKVRESNVVTALHAACQQENFDMIYFLLENGADLNVCGELDSVVHFAKIAEQSNTDLSADFHHGTPLSFASGKGDIKLVTCLLECDADPNLQGGLYSTALQAACRNGKLEVVNLLFKHGADPNLTGGQWSSALHACPFNSRAAVDCVRALLEHKADPDVRNKDGDTPLHNACCEGNTKVAELLLNFRADPTIRSAYLILAYSNLLTLGLQITEAKRLFR